jgi:FkbM family methyltransferase
MIKWTELIRKYTAVTPQTRQLAEELASVAGGGRRYVLGRNADAAALSRVFAIDAVVDDFAESGSMWNGKPVIGGASVPRDGIVVNCSTSISPVSAGRRLESLRVKGVLSYSDLCRVFPDRVPLPEFVLKTRLDLEQNSVQWRHLWDSLEDDLSRRVLDDIIAFRVTGDYRLMKTYSVRMRDEYFEAFVRLAPGEVFVDGGGFDGDTTEEFCAKCPGHRKVFLFEPSARNMRKACARLSKFTTIEYIEEGLSDAVGLLPFDPDAGSASAVSESGACRMHATTLDFRVRESVSFIKMDLEGWELRALEGSRRHLVEDHPKLAIAVYHLPEHFRQVFAFITGLRSDYKVHLRHYSEGWSETVMYFVPSENASDAWKRYG